MTAASHRPRRLRRVAIPAVLGAGALATARLVLRRRPAIAPVAPDLRNPVLYLPLSLRSDRVLQLIRSMPMPTPAAPPGITIETTAVPTDAGRTVRTLTYQRAGRTRPSGALLWIHGGGMVLGVPEQAHILACRWAEELGILVVAPDYRLAPEDPFPAGLDDCDATLQWLHDHADELGIDPERIAVGGDSAGGGLAASLAQRARDRGGPSICFQLLEYPMLDDRTVLRADHGGRGAFIWTPDSNRFGWTAYLGHAPSSDDERPYAAPARTDDLAGLPAAWVGVGDLDLFHDEDVDYARRLQDAGVPCDLHVEPRMYHGADSIMPTAPTTRAFRDAMTAALAAGLGAELRPAPA